jgi:MtN3 and saliva related transmembrane protein
MSTEWVVGTVGTVAGFCTTIAFVPQVVKIWKQGARDLSYAMLAIYLLGVLLWLIYGLLLHSPAIIWTNTATAFLIVFATASKAWKDRQATARGAVAPQAVERA